MKTRFWPKNVQKQQESIAINRPGQKIHKLAWFVDMVAYALWITNNVSFASKEAIKYSEIGQWKKANDEEMYSLFTLFQKKKKLDN